MLGTGGALAVSNTAGYPASLTKRTGNLNVGGNNSLIELTDGAGNNPGDDAFGSYDPRGSSATTHINLKNTTSKTVSLSLSQDNSNVSLSSSSFDLSAGNDKDIELSHSQSSDQNLTLTVAATETNQTVSYDQSLDIPVTPSSAIARWTLEPSDRNSGSIVDAWASGYDGAAKTHPGGGDTYSDLEDTTLADSSSGNPNYATGGSTSFSGTQHVAIQDSSLLSELNNTATETVSAWMRASNSSNGNPSIVTNGYASNDIGLSLFYEMGSGNNLKLGRYTNSNNNWDYVDTNNVFSDVQDSWTHFCVTHDEGSGNATIYINGTEVENGDLNSSQYERYLAINSRWDSEDSFTGEFQDVRYYDTVLSDSEVTNLYNTGHI